MAKENSHWAAVVVAAFSLSQEIQYAAGREALGTANEAKFRVSRGVFHGPFGPATAAGLGDAALIA